MYKILLIEDSPEYQMLVAITLGQEFQVHAAESISAARVYLSTNAYDLILLEVSLPDGNGFDYCSEMKAAADYRQTPIVVLSGWGDEQDRVKGWSLGVDDYIVKPFAPLEFQARLKSRIDRHRRQSDVGTILRWSSVTLDLNFHNAKVDEAGAERKLDLTPTEFKILHCLVKNFERVLSRAQLIESAWGPMIHVTERTVDKHISTLRHKLNSRNANIRTVSGLGYTLVRA